MCICVYIYIYIEREIYSYVYIYIYIYTLTHLYPMHMSSCCSFGGLHRFRRFGAQGISCCDSPGDEVLVAIV